MTVRLVVAIADAVRRHEQRKNRADAHPPPPEQAMSQAAGDLKELMPPDLSSALTASADWPHLAQMLVALQNAGVNLENFLPQVARIAVTVRDSVAANAARVARDGAGEWEKLLRETLPAGPVREAILSSPTWPDIAATMAWLDERGVDIRQLLAAAHEEGVGVDQAVRRVPAAGEVPTPGRDAMLSYGPMTTELDIPKDLDLNDRARAFRQLAISPRDNERFTRLVREAMPGREREANLMFTAKQWPLVAARMAHMESTQQPLKDHLAGLVKNPSWEQGPGTQLASRLVQATTDVLRRPPGAATSRPGTQVSTAAARSRSSTGMGPFRAQRSKGAPSAERGVAPHREAAPSAKSGQAR